MKEFFSSIQTSFTERFSSPLLGGFFIFWSIANFDAYLMLFSKQNVFEKIYYIQSYTLPSWSYEYFLSYKFYAPFVYLSVYLFLYP